MKFRITFKSGLETVAVIDGVIRLKHEQVTVADFESILGTEMFLEKLTGLRVHIEQTR